VPRGHYDFPSHLHARRRSVAIPNLPDKAPQDPTHQAAIDMALALLRQRPSPP